MDERIRTVFRDVFDDPRLAIDDTTSSRDVAGWDSLAQVRLIIGLEQEFRVSFSTEDLALLSAEGASVGDLKRVVRDKLRGS